MPTVRWSNARPVRCAIYARKSVTDGLETELNSLVVQREICSAYIRSQRHRQWAEMPEVYEDGATPVATSTGRAFHGC